MKLPILNMQCVTAFVICNFLPLAVARYKDLGHLCLDGIQDELYRSLQPNITYTATQYPIVTNGTNVTLTCTGSSKQPNFVQPDDLSYITTVEFYKNDKPLDSCRKDGFLQFRTLSCKVSISGATDDDKFWCIIRASNAPCNVAEISFQIENPVAPTISRLIPTFKNDARTMEVICIGTGIPEPRVSWLLNGSTINSTSNEKTINTEVITKPPSFQNGTNTYHVHSKLVITGTTFPLRIQCVVENSVRKVYSQSVYVLSVKVMVSKLSTATLRWMEYLHRNSSLHSSSGYNVSLKCGKNCFETTRLYNKSGVILRQLTMGKTYTANVQGLTKTGDLIVGATKFYSPDMLPKSDNIYLKMLTSRKAVVSWKNISANVSIHGVLLGYKLGIIGKEKNENISLSSHANDVVLSPLIRKSKYAVRLLGFTQYGDGNILEFNFTTLDIIPAPQNVKITNVMGNFVVVQWTVIKQKTEKYDVVTGYMVTVANQIYSFHVETSSNVSSVFVDHLLPNTGYSVSVVGLSDKTKGMPSEPIHFKTSDIEDPPPTTNNPGDHRDKTEKIESNLTFTIVVPVVVAVGVITLLIALTIIEFRRRNKAKKSWNPIQNGSKTNIMVEMPDIQ